MVSPPPVAPHSRLTLALAVVGLIFFFVLLVVALADLDLGWLREYAPKGMQGKSPH